MRLRLGHGGSMPRGSTSAERVRDPLLLAERRIASLVSVRDGLQVDNDNLAARHNRYSVDLAQTCAPCSSADGVGSCLRTGVLVPTRKVCAV